MSNHDKSIEETLEFKPRYNDQGLIPCIATSARTGEVLMFAWMNEEALLATLKTGEMHYYSRSRQELWHKGATSGHVQKVKDLKIDCDQDCLWATVDVDPEIACHTGRETCFYRVVKSKDGSDTVHLEFSDHGDRE